MKRILFFVLMFVAGSLHASEEGLTAADRKAITGVLDDYVAAWLAGDAERVMRLLSDDSVLIPHHGLEPVVGAKAIRAWWWPPDAKVTTIHRFVLRHDEIGGAGGWAFVRGRQSLEWTTGTKPGRANGNQLTLLRKSVDGEWRITHQMWGDPPNERQ